jgi:hypothetical protein
MRSDGTHVLLKPFRQHMQQVTLTHAGTMRAAPPTAEDLARLDAQTKTALDSILTGTTQSRTSLEREFPALSKAAAPFKTFDEPDHVAGEKLSFLEAERAIQRDKAEMDATAERIYREAMREDEERTEHLKTGTSGGRLSLYEADPPPMQCDNFVEEESDVEETIDGQLPAPPPSTVVEAKPAVRRGFLNRTPEPPAPPPPPPKPVGETTPVEAFKLEEDFDYDNCPLSAPPPSMAESVLAWERDQFGPGGKPPVEAMSSDEEPEVVVEEDLVDEGAE